MSDKDLKIWQNQIGKKNAEAFLKAKTKQTNQILFGLIALAFLATITGLFFIIKSFL